MELSSICQKHNFLMSLRILTGYKSLVILSWIASERQQAILFGQEKVQWLKYHAWTKTWGQLLFKLINWSD